MFHQIEMPLSIKRWRCPNYTTEHDRDQNAAKQTVQEAIFKLKADDHTVTVSAWSKARFCQT